LFPLLGANYLFDPPNPLNDNIAPLLKPYEILNVNGLRIAVIGMGNTSSMTSIAQGGNSLGITPIEPIELVRDLVAVLQPRVDLIFVVSHLGLSANGQVSLAEDQELLTGYESIVPKNAVRSNWKVLGEEPNDQVRVSIPGVVGIDAIFGGHLHIVLNPPKV